jgi:hypothetical protein
MKKMKKGIVIPSPFTWFCYDKKEEAVESIIAEQRKKDPNFYENDDSGEVDPYYLKFTLNQMWDELSENMKQYYNDKANGLNPKLPIEERELHIENPEEYIKKRKKTKGRKPLKDKSFYRLW